MDFLHKNYFQELAAVHDSLAEMIIKALDEGEVFTGADKEYAFQLEILPRGCKIWERDDRGASNEKILTKEELSLWLRHFPFSYLASQLQGWLVNQGMKMLEAKDYPKAFIFFTMAAEHGMELGNLGLALLYNRQMNPDEAAAALAAVNPSTGIPYSEIPIKSFLIQIMAWNNRKKSMALVKEFLKIAPEHRDALTLLKALSQP